MSDGRLLHGQEYFDELGVVRRYTQQVQDYPPSAAAGLTGIEGTANVNQQPQDRASAVVRTLAAPAVPGTPRVSYEIDSDGIVVTVTKTVKAIGSITPGESVSGGLWTATSADPVSFGPGFADETVRVRAIPGAYLYGTEIDPDSNLTINTTTRLVANGSRGAVFSPAATSISAATVATRTVVSVASTTGLSPGMQVTVTGNSNCTPDLDGTHFITAVGTGTVTLDFQVTANTSSGSGGTLALAAEVHREIKPQSGAVSVELCSQINPLAIPEADVTYFTGIDFSWPEVLAGINVLDESGSTNSSSSGTWPIPSTINFVNGYEDGGEACIKMRRHSGSSSGRVVREFFVSPPPELVPDSFQLSTGEVAVLVQAYRDADAYGFSDVGTAHEGTTTTSKNFRVTSIPACLTGDLGGSGGIVIGASYGLYLDESVPPSLVPGADFVADVRVSRGRLGSFIRESFILYVPDSIGTPP